METRARKYATKQDLPWDTPKIDRDIEYHYLQGALEQERVDFWKARRVFCKTTCPGGCPQKKNDIEGGGGLVVSCDKLSLFIKTWKNS